MVDICGGTHGVAQDQIELGNPAKSTRLKKTNSALGIGDLARHAHFFLVLGATSKYEMGGGVKEGISLVTKDKMTSPF